MMKSAILAAALAVLAGAAHAQQSPPPDPYRTLLIEANDRVATLAGQVHALDAKVKELAKALEDEKAKAGKPCPDGERQQHDGRCTPIAAPLDDGRN